MSLRSLFLTCALQLWQVTAFSAFPGQSGNLTDCLQIKAAGLCSDVTRVSMIGAFCPNTCGMCKNQQCSEKAISYGEYVAIAYSYRNAGIPMPALIAARSAFPNLSGGCMRRDGTRSPDGGSGNGLCEGVCSHDLLHGMHAVAIVRRACFSAAVLMSGSSMAHALIDVAALTCHRRPRGLRQ